MKGIVSVEAVERDESPLADYSYVLREHACVLIPLLRWNRKDSCLGMVEECWAKDLHVHPAAEAVGTVWGLGDFSGEIQTHCRISFLNDGKDAEDKFVGIWVGEFPKTVIF